VNAEAVQTMPVLDSFSEAEKIRCKYAMGADIR
jgi:hypothetical protein